MSRTVAYLLSLAIIAAAISLYFLMGRVRASQVNGSSSSETEPKGVVAAPGRVEALSEEIKVGSEISGKIRSLLVEEGDRVRRGQVVAVLENDDYKAAVASAQAEMSQKEAQLRRVINGARDQERREAWAAVQEAEAARNNARSQMERRRRLFAEGVSAREEVDRTQWEFRAAQARFAAAVQHHALINAKAREEDRSKAQADVAGAQAQLGEARARLEKTFIRSPIDGVVLRRHLKAGESVTDSPDNPVVTVADNSVLRVRVDVDETDVGKIRLGQQAYVSAEAFAGRKFPGRVVRISRLLGKKNVHTDEPTERVDTKILETLIQLDDGHELPLGLRVDALISLADAPRTQK
jgi:ABC exporter DevB family membrane fusion protein